MCVEHQLNPPDPRVDAGKLGKRGVVKGSMVVNIVHICQTGSMGRQLNVQQWSMGC